MSTDVELRKVLERMATPGQCRVYAEGLGFVMTCNAETARRALRIIGRWGKAGCYRWQNTTQRAVKPGKPERLYRRPYGKTPKWWNGLQVKAMATKGTG
jgi:hypothetical protein